MSSDWKMPRPSMGDVVLYSNDPHSFSGPCIAWVMKEPGDTTIQLLTFTEMTGFVVRPSVHHRDDPALREDNGWQGLGVWDFTDSAKAATKAPQRPVEMSRERQQTPTK